MFLEDLLKDAHGGFTHSEWSMETPKCSSAWERGELVAGPAAESCLTLKLPPRAATWWELENSGLS